MKILHGRDGHHMAVLSLHHARQEGQQGLETVTGDKLTPLFLGILKTNGGIYSNCHIHILPTY
jgi:hypothetical protein